MTDGLSIVEVILPGIYGNLEGRLLYSQEEEAGAGLILFPPHPLLAGNMDNNVVQAVARRMATFMPVLLFNYPAVGNSYRPRPDLPLFEYWNTLDQHGTYETVIKEARQVIAESSRYFPRYHLAGYSFGAVMALAALTPAALSYTAIAPPLAEHDFSRLATLSLPVCIIRAERDDLLATPSNLPSGGNVLISSIKGSDHFFLQREQAVADHLAEMLQHTTI